MTIEEVNKVLNDKTMQDKETNFKVKDSKSSGKSKKITLELLANQLVKTNDKVEFLANQLVKTNDKVEFLANQLVKTNDKVEFLANQLVETNKKVELLANRLDAFYNQFLEFSKLMLDKWTKQEQFNELIINRLDNLVKKNNLKE